MATITHELDGVKFTSDDDGKTWKEAPGLFHKVHGKTYLSQDGGKTWVLHRNPLDKVLVGGVAITGKLIKWVTTPNQKQIKGTSTRKSTGKKKSQKSFDPPNFEDRFADNPFDR